MTITLADVYKLTDLRITRSVHPYEYLNVGSKKLAKILDCTGWASYILNHIGDESTVSEREYVAFLNMWLERFILWFDLQSQTYCRASGSRQVYYSWKVSVRSCLPSKLLGSYPVTEE